MNTEVMERRDDPATSLPAGLEAYRRTPDFTESSIPAGLLKLHSTKAGTWGLIRVEAGELIYRIIDERRPTAELRLKAGGRPGIVEPTIVHEVEPAGQVRFHVEFLRAAPQA